MEDHNFASINYVHWGEGKRWFGVPGAFASQFEKAIREVWRCAFAAATVPRAGPGGWQCHSPGCPVRALTPCPTVLLDCVDPVCVFCPGGFFRAQIAPELFFTQPDLLLQLVTMASPKELIRRGVPVVTTLQQAGEFVITFPKAFHGGYNHGLNCAEAVNFAMCSWFSAGFEAEVGAADESCVGCWVSLDCVPRFAVASVSVCVCVCSLRLPMSPFAVLSLLVLAYALRAGTIPEPPTYTRVLPVRPNLRRE